MAKNSDKEFALKRKIKDLEQLNKQKDLELAQLKKKLEKSELKETKKKGTVTKEACCPNCGASIKSSKLPFGKLNICSKACGWREVKKVNK